MFVVLLIIDIIAIIKLLIISAISPECSRLSLFEIERRVKTGDKEAIRHLNSVKVYDNLLFLKQLCINLLLVLIGFISVLAFGWWIGGLVSVLTVILHGGVSKFVVIKKISKNVYAKINKPTLSFAEKHAKLLNFFRPAGDGRKGEHRIASTQELQHLIQKSDHILTPLHRRIMTSGLVFDTTPVRDVMIQRLRVRVVEKGELLGPLVLNDLHKSGHSKLPVVKSNFDEVIGILYLDDILKIDTEKTLTAENAMNQKVIYVEQNQTLDEVLGLMLASGINLLIVTDEQQVNVGIVTLSDVMKFIFGN